MVFFRVGCGEVRDLQERRLLFFVPVFIPVLATDRPTFSNEESFVLALIVGCRARMGEEKRRAILGGEGGRVLTPLSEMTVMRFNLCK